MKENKKLLLRKELLNASAFLFGFGTLGLIGWLIYELQNKNQTSEIQEINLHEKIYKNWKARVFEDKIKIFDEKNDIIINPSQKLYDLDPSLKLSIISNYDIVKQSYDRYGSFERWKQKCPAYNYYYYFENNENLSTDDFFWGDWWTNDNFFSIPNPLLEAQKQDERIISLDKNNLNVEKCIRKESRNRFGILVGKNQEKFVIFDDKNFIFELKSKRTNYVFIGFDDFNKHMKIQTGIDKTYSYHNIGESNVLFEKLDEFLLKWKNESIETYGDFKKNTIFSFRNRRGFHFWTLNKDSVITLKNLNLELDIQDQTKVHNYQSIDQLLNDGYQVIHMARNNVGKSIPYYGKFYNQNFLTQCVDFKDTFITNKSRFQYCKKVIDRNIFSVKNFITKNNKIVDAVFTIQKDGEEITIPNIDVFNFLFLDQLGEKNFRLLITLSEFENINGAEIDFSVLDLVFDKTKTTINIPATSGSKPITSSDEPETEFFKLFNSDEEFNPWVKEFQNFNSALEKINKDISIQKFASFFSDDGQLNKKYLHVSKITFDEMENINSISFETDLNLENKNKKIIFNSLKDLNLELKKQKSDFVDLTFDDFDETFINFDKAKSTAIFGDFDEKIFDFDFDLTTKKFTFQISNMKKMENFQIFIDQIKNQIKDWSGTSLDFQYLLDDLNPLILIETIEDIRLLFQLNNFEVTMSKYFNYFFNDWTKHNFEIETYSENHDEIVFVLKDDTTKKITGLNNLEKVISIQNGTPLEGLTNDDKLLKIDNFLQKKSIFNFGKLVTENKINKNLINIDFDQDQITFLIPGYLKIPSLSSFNLELQKQGFNEIFNIENISDLNHFKNSEYAKSVYQNGKWTNWNAQIFDDNILIINAFGQTIFLPNDEIIKQDPTKKLENIKNYSTIFLDIKNAKSFLEKESQILQEIENFENLDKNTRPQIKSEISFLESKIEALNNLYQIYSGESLNFKKFCIYSSRLFDSLENDNLYHQKIQNLNFFLQGLKINLETKNIIDHPFAEEYKKHIEKNYDKDILIFLKEEKLNVGKKIKIIDNYLNDKKNWKNNSQILENYLQKIDLRIFVPDDEQLIINYNLWLKEIFEKIDELIFKEESKRISLGWKSTEVNDWIEKVQLYILQKKQLQSKEKIKLFDESFGLKIEILLQIKNGFDLIELLNTFNIDNIDLNLDETHQKIIDLENYFENYQSLDDLEKEAFDINVSQDWEKNLKNYQQKLLESLKSLIEKNSNDLIQKIENDTNDPDVLILIKEKEIDDYYQNINEFKVFLNNLNELEKTDVSIEFINDVKDKLDKAFSDLIIAHEALILATEKPLIIEPENFKNHFGSDFERDLDEIIQKIEIQVLKIVEHIKIYNSLGEEGKEKYGPDLTKKFNIYINNLNDYLKGLKLLKSKPEIIPLEQIKKDETEEFRDSLKQIITQKINEFDFFLSKFKDLSAVGKIVFENSDIIVRKEDSLINLNNYQRGMRLYDQKPFIFEDISSFAKEEVQNIIFNIATHLKEYNYIISNEFAKKGYGFNYSSLLNTYKNRLFDRKIALELKYNVPDILDDIRSLSKVQINEMKNAIDDHLINYNNLKIDGIIAYGISPISELNDYLNRLLDRKNGLELKENVVETPKNISSFSKEQIIEKKNVIENHLISYNNLEKDGKDAYGDDPTILLKNFIDRLLDRKNGLELKENVVETPEDISSFSKKQIIEKKDAIENHLINFNILEKDGKDAYGDDATISLNFYIDRLLDRKNGLELKENVVETSEDISSFSKKQIIEKKDAIENHLINFNILEKDGKDAYGIDPTILLNPYIDRLFDRERGLNLNEQIPETPEDISSFSKKQIIEKKDAIDNHLINFNILEKDGKDAYGIDPTILLNPYIDRLFDRERGLNLNEQIPETPEDISSFSKDQIIEKKDAIDNHLINFNILEKDGKDAYGIDPTLSLNTFIDRLFDREWGLNLNEQIPETPEDISLFSKKQIIEKKDAIDNHLISYNDLKEDGKTGYGIDQTDSLINYLDRLLNRKTGLILKENVPEIIENDDIALLDQETIELKITNINEYLEEYNNLNIDGKNVFEENLNDSNHQLQIFLNNLSSHKVAKEIKDSIPDISSTISSFKTIIQIDLKKSEIDNFLTTFNNQTKAQKEAFGFFDLVPFSTYINRLIDRKNGLELKENVIETPIYISSFSKEQIIEKKDAIDNHLISYNNLKEDGKDAYGDDPTSSLNFYINRLIDRKNGLELKENVIETPIYISSLTKEQIMVKKDAIENHLISYNDLKIDGKISYGDDPTSSLNSYLDRLFDRERGLNLKEQVLETPIDISSFSKKQIIEKKDAIENHLINFNILEKDGKDAYGDDATISLNNFIDRLLDRKNGLELKENVVETPEDISSFSKEQIIEKKDAIENHLINFNILEKDGKDAYGIDPTILLNPYIDRLFDREWGLNLNEQIPETPEDISSFSKKQIIEKKDAIENHLINFNILEKDGKDAYGIDPTILLNPYIDRLFDRKDGLELKENVPEIPNDISTFSKEQIMVKKDTINNHLISYNDLKEDGKIAYGIDPTSSLNSYLDRLFDRETGLILKENVPEIIENDDIALLNQETIELKITNINEYLEEYNNLNIDGKNVFEENLNDSNHQLQIFLNNLSSHKVAKEIKDSIPDISSTISSFETINQIDLKKSEIDNFLIVFKNQTEAQKEAFGSFDLDPFSTFIDRLLDRKNGLELKENVVETPEDISSFSKDQIIEKKEAIDNHLISYNKLEKDGKDAYGNDPTISLNFYIDRLIDRKDGLELKENVPEIPNDISTFSKEQIMVKKDTINNHLISYNDLKEDGKITYGIDPTSSLNSYLDRLFDRKNGLELKENVVETPEDISLFSKEQIIEKKDAIDNHLISYNKLEKDGKDAYGIDPTLSLNTFIDRLLDRKNGLELKENVVETPEDISSFSKDQIIEKKEAIDNHLISYNKLEKDGKDAYGINPTLSLNTFIDRLFDREWGLNLNEQIPETPEDISSFSKDQIIEKKDAIENHLIIYNDLKEDGKTAYGNDPTILLNPYINRLIDRKDGLELKENVPEIPNDISTFSKEQIMVKKDTIDNHLISYNDLKEDGKIAYGIDPTSSLNSYLDRLFNRETGLILKENVPEIIENDDIALLDQETIELKITNINEYLEEYNNLNIDGKNVFEENLNDSNHQLQIFLNNLSSHKVAKEIKDSIPDISSTISSFETINKIDLKKSEIDNFLTTFNNQTKAQKEAFGSFDLVPFSTYINRLIDRKNGLELKENILETPIYISSFSKEQIIEKKDAIDNHLISYNDLKEDGKIAYGDDPNSSLNSYLDRLFDRKNGLELKENVVETPEDISSFSKEQIIEKKDAIENHLISYNDLKIDGKISYGDDPTSSLNSYLDRLFDRERGLNLKEQVLETPIDISTFSKEQIIEKKDAIDNHLISYNDLKEDGKTAYGNDPTILLNPYINRLIDRKDGLELKENVPEIPNDISTFSKEQIMVKKDTINNHLISYNDLKEDGKTGYGIDPTDSLINYLDRLLDRKTGLILKENVPEIIENDDIALLERETIELKITNINEYLEEYNNLNIDGKNVFEENLNDSNHQLQIFLNNLSSHKVAKEIKDSIPDISSTISSFETIIQIDLKKSEIDNFLTTFNNQTEAQKEAFGFFDLDPFTIYIDRLIDRKNGLELKEQEPNISLLISDHNISEGLEKILKIDEYLINFNALKNDGKQVFNNDPTLLDSDINIYKQKLNDHIKGLELKEELNFLLSTDISTFSQNDTNNKINEIDNHIFKYQKLETDGLNSYENSDPNSNESLNTLKDNLIDRFDGFELKKIKDQIYSEYKLDDSSALLEQMTSEEVINEINVINDHLSKYNNLKTNGLSVYQSDISTELNNHKQRLSNFLNGLYWLEDEENIALDLGILNVEALATYDVNLIAGEQTAILNYEVENLKDDYIFLTPEGKQAVGKDVQNDNTIPINIFYLNLSKRNSINIFGRYQDWEINFNGIENIENMFFTSQNYYGDNIVVSNDVYLNELEKQQGVVDDILSYYIWNTKQIYGDLWNETIKVDFDDLNKKLTFQVDGKQKINGLDIFNEKLDILRNGIIDKSDDYTPFNLEDQPLTLENFEISRYNWSYWTYGGDLFYENDFFCNSWNVNCENQFPRDRLSISRIFFNDSYEPIDFIFNLDNSDMFGPDENAVIDSLENFDKLIRWHGFAHETFSAINHVKNTWFNTQYNEVSTEQEKIHSLESFGNLFIDSDIDYVDKNVLTIEKFQGISTDTTTGVVHYSLPTFSISGKEKTIYETENLNLHLRKQGYQGPDILNTDYDSSWNGYVEASEAKNAEFSTKNINHQIFDHQSLISSLNFLISIPLIFILILKGVKIFYKKFFKKSK